MSTLLFKKDVEQDSNKHGTMTPNMNASVLIWSLSIVIPIWWPDSSPAVPAVLPANEWYSFEASAFRSSKAERAPCKSRVISEAFPGGEGGTSSMRLNNNMRGCLKSWRFFYRANPFGSSKSTNANLPTHVVHHHNNTYIHTYYSTNWNNSRVRVVCIIFIRKNNWMKKTLLSCTTYWGGE